LSTGRIEVPGGQYLPLPKGGFEADLVQAASVGNAAALLERLFGAGQAELTAEEQKQLALEVLELDLTRGRLLDHLPWLDRFLELVLSAPSGLRYRRAEPAAGTATAAAAQGGREER